MFRKIKNSKEFNRKSAWQNQTVEENFQNILAARRSDSANISDRYYEDLLRIWDGSPSIEAQPIGASTSDINDSIQTGISSSTNSDNNTTGVSSCSDTVVVGGENPIYTKILLPTNGNIWNAN